MGFDETLHICYDLLYSVGLPDAGEKKINKNHMLSVLTLLLSRGIVTWLVFPRLQQEVVRLGCLHVYLSFLVFF